MLGVCVASYLSLSAPVRHVLGVCVAAFCFFFFFFFFFFGGGGGGGSVFS